MNSRLHKDAAQVRGAFGFLTGHCFCMAGYGAAHWQFWAFGIPIAVTFCIWLNKELGI